MTIDKFASLRDMSAGLEAGEYTSVELTEAHLTDIEQRNKQSNSFITIAREHALAQAKAADVKRANGKATLLTGVPIAHKDIFLYQGSFDHLRIKNAQQFLRTLQFIYG